MGCFASILTPSVGLSLGALLHGLPGGRARQTRVLEMYTYSTDVDGPCRGPGNPQGSQNVPTVCSRLASSRAVPPERLVPLLGLVLQGGAIAECGGRARRALVAFGEDRGYDLKDLGVDRM